MPNAPRLDENRSLHSYDACVDNHERGCRQLRNTTDDIAHSGEGILAPRFWVK